MYNEYLVPAIVAFVISAVWGYFAIPLLQKLKAGQTVRDDGPQTHLAKNGTPTMGGIIFLLAYFLSCIIYMIAYEPSTDIISVMICTLGFAIIGFIDDFIKVVLKRSMGLRAWQKMGLQIVFSIGYLIYMVNVAEISTSVTLPIINTDVDMGFFTYILLFIMLLGTTNGANFTDGVDGLATSVTMAIALCLTFIAAAVESPTGFSSIAMAAALMGFLLYNSHKASVFMGDIGSLALGGFVAGTVISMEMPLHILFIGIIYLAEVLSVIIQVGYFKISGGKRIFRMAPIHHHFELGGWKETKVVAVFTIVTIALCALMLFGF